jgi:hypothetical protein
LVKIQTRISRKRYLNSKRTYEYGRMSLDIPKRFHEILRPFLDKDLRFDVRLENGRLEISLSPVDIYETCKYQSRES